MKREIRILCRIMDRVRNRITSQPASDRVSIVSPVPRNIAAPVRSSALTVEGNMEDIPKDSGRTNPLSYASVVSSGTLVPSYPYRTDRAPSTRVESPPPPGRSWGTPQRASSPVPSILAPSESSTYPSLQTLSHDLTCLQEALSQMQVCSNSIHGMVELLQKQEAERIPTPVPRATSTPFLDPRSPTCDCIAPFHDLPPFPNGAPGNTHWKTFGEVNRLFIPPPCALPDDATEEDCRRYLRNFAQWRRERIWAQEGIVRTCLQILTFLNHLPPLDVAHGCPGMHLHRDRALRYPVEKVFEAFKEQGLTTLDAPRRPWAVTVATQTEVTEVPALTQAPKPPRYWHHRGKKASKKQNPTS